MTIINGHVFNQIVPIYAQAPMPQQVRISNSDLKWTGIIGTNGKLISRYLFPDIEKIVGEESKDRIQKMTEIKEQMVQTIWAIK